MKNKHFSTLNSARPKHKHYFRNIYIHLINHEPFSVLHITLPPTYYISQGTFYYSNGLLLQSGEKKYKRQNNLKWEEIAKKYVTLNDECTLFLQKNK